MTVVYAAEETVKIQELKKHYFQRFWNRLNLGQVLAFMFYVALKTLHKTSEEIFDIKHDELQGLATDESHAPVK